jgi:SAM-dependent methyltransferase
MTTRQVRASSQWLTLREPADAAARAADLVEEVRSYLPVDRLTTVHDLGCGTGSMARWLAPQLPGPQHWVMFDRDDDLLAVAAANPPVRASDGSSVTFETRRCDITRLGAEDLAEGALITASALLDMLTAEELGRLVATCAAAGRPALIALSVVGRVELAPVDPVDERVADAFNAHQRRDNGAGPLLGPDAVSFSRDAFRRLGVDVVVRPSPWRLGPDQAALAAEWFTGWLAAACEQEPELEAVSGAYAQRRLAEAAAGLLSVTVHHADLLVRPR